MKATQPGNTDSSSSRPQPTARPVACHWDNIQNVFWKNNREQDPIFAEWAPTQPDNPQCTTYQWQFTRSLIQAINGNSPFQEAIQDLAHPGARILHKDDNSSKDPQPRNPSTDELEIKSEDDLETQFEDAESRSLEGTITPKETTQEEEPLKGKGRDLPPHLSFQTGTNPFQAGTGQYQPSQIPGTTSYPTPQPAMSNNSKKYGKPISFKGDGSDDVTARTWKYQMETYLENNSSDYPTDKEKIHFFLSMMKEGPASEWARSKGDDAKAKNATTPDYGTYKDFLEDFEKAWISANLKQEARRKVMFLRQKPGETITAFNSRFQTMANTGDMKEFNSLSEMYYNAINPSILREIMRQPAQPKTMKEAYTSAVDAEAALHRLHTRAQQEKDAKAQRIAAFNTNRRAPPPPPIPRSTPWRYQNRRVPANTGFNPSPGMGPRLSADDTARYRREGRCFGCGQTGHFRSNCPRSGNRFRPRNIQILNLGQEDGYSQFETNERPSYHYTPPPRTTQAPPGNSNRERGSNNPFRGLPSTDAKPPNITNIRELITQLPSEEFDALFDELEEKDFH